MFRLLAATLVPVLLLGGAEAALRLAGRGHETSFLLERTVQGERVVVENDKFGWRFFPASVARSPAPVLFRAAKRPGSIRIFLFGESAALGDPKPGYGFGRFLEVLLKERFPGTDFEVVCVAMTAINSHAILPIARECARYDGDLWVVYMGNNEMEGPFGANTIFGAKAPQLPFIRATLALRSTRLGQWLVEAARRAKGKDEPPVAWEGMKMFLRQQLAPDAASREIVHAHFRKNLEDIVATGLRAGARPVVCTVASNLKDCSPFASLNGGGPATADRTAWKDLFDAGIRAQAAQKWDEAAKLYGQAVEKDPLFAELQFRAGQCAVQAADPQRARELFAKARDTDALPFRTDGAMNADIREVAARFADRGVRWVDVEADLAKQSPGNLPGDELFFDHVHLNFDGNYRVARLIAEPIGRDLPAATTAKAAPGWASAELCARRLGLTPWNRLAAYESMLLRLSDAPFTNQLSHLDRSIAMVATIRRLREQVRSADVAGTRQIFDEAIAAGPSDPRLHEGYAEFLEAAGLVPEATAEWQKVAALLPHHHLGTFQAGRLLSRQQKDPEAMAALDEALRLRPDLGEARIERGQIHLRAKRYVEALAEFTTVQKQRPEDPRVLVQIAHVQGAQKHVDEAMATLAEAIRLQPGYWEPHYLLGIEHAARGDMAKALAEFKEVTRLRPNYASGRFNYGVALAKAGAIAEATSEFQETLRLDPKNAQARQYLQSLRTMRPKPATRPE